MSEQSEQIHFETALDDAGNRVVKATTEGHTTNLSTWSDLAQFLHVSMEIKKPAELYGTWLSETAEDKALRELAAQYHTRCDAFDRTVCTGISPRTGEAMPVDPYEYRSINAHARRVRDEINRQGYSMGFTDEQVIRAIQNYAKGRCDE